MTWDGERSGDYYRAGFDRLLLWFGVLTFCSYVFEGPLRLLLTGISAESAIYLRDVAAVLAVGLVASSWLRGQQRAAPLMAVLALLSAHCVIGMLSLPSPFQALFGFKVFLVFLLGFSIAPLVRARPEALVRFAALSFLATAIGVIVNLFVDYPWIGLNYDTAFGSTVAARQWWADDTLRLPGFSRASFTAASIMVVALVPLLCSRLSPWLKALATALAFGTAALTTSKGALLALSVLVASHVMTVLLRNRQLSNALIVALALCGLALPIAAVEVGAATGAVPSWLASFMERVGDMWPRALGLFDHGGQWLWGRGLGGIGTAQDYGEWHRANSADNLMLYILVAFGVCGIVYVAAFLLRLLGQLAARPSDDFETSCASGWTLAWLAYGFTGGMIDLPTMNMTMGLVFGLVFTRRKAAELAEPSLIGAWR